MNLENYTKIIMGEEYIMLYDDRITISWLDKFDDSIVDFNTQPRKHKIGSIIMLAVLIVFIPLSCFLFPRHFVLTQGIIMVFIWLIMWLYQFVYLSDTTLIQRNEIKRVYIGQRRMSVIIKNKIIKRKREIILPYNPHDRETVLQLLRENKLID